LKGASGGFVSAVRERQLLPGSFEQADVPISKSVPLFVVRRFFG
jgi:hypothetical protein